MPYVSDALYALCESRLKGRMEAIEQAQRRLEEARAAAYAVHGANFDKVGGSGSGRGSALEKAALRITEAENALREALRWDDIAHRLQRAYPASSTKQGLVAMYLFDRGMTQADAARLMGVERGTIRRWKDDYLMACALYAVEAGLAKVDDDGKR